MYKPLKILRIIASILCVIIFALDVIDFIKIFNAKPIIIEKSNTIDGIVVFTGGEDRIKTSIDLLSSGIAKHLFISGVHPDTNKNNISEQILIDTNLIDCCIDLGSDAKDTFENAVETTHWIKKNEYKKIIIVTSDYHMKRSLLILKNLSEDTSFFPYHVKSKLLNDMNVTKFEKLRIIVLEYSKYLFTRLRLSFDFN